MLPPVCSSNSTNLNAVAQLVGILNTLEEGGVLGHTLQQTTLSPAELQAERGKLLLLLHAPDATSAGCQPAFNPCCASINPTYSGHTLNMHAHLNAKRVVGAALYIRETMQVWVMA